MEIAVVAPPFRPVGTPPGPEPAWRPQPWTGFSRAGAGGSGAVGSGFLEMSNVDLTQEFTSMITTQRGF